MRITRLPHRFPPLWPPLWPPASLRCTAIPPAYTRLEGKQKKLWRIPVLLWRGAWAPPLKKSISPPAAASRTTGPLRAQLMPKRKKGKSILLQQSLNITPFFILFKPLQRTALKLLIWMFMRMALSVRRIWKKRSALIPPLSPSCMPIMKSAPSSPSPWRPLPYRRCSGHWKRAHSRQETGDRYAFSFRT